ncbi:MAG: NIPSNAP family protein [Desulfobacterium sp.]|nr:NIPSNAP family protein [Desulfobacterium sp.]
MTHPQEPFFELRIYPVFPGCMERLVTWMEERVIPFQTSMGMVVTGSFISLENKEEYIWIRRFENEEEKNRLYDNVYKSREWIEEIGEVNGTLIDRKNIRVVRMKATPHSVIS